MNKENSEYESSVVPVFTNCHFFVKYRSGGNCHRYPPQILAVSATGGQYFENGFPDISNPDETGCGEFKKKI